MGLVLTLASVVTQVGYKYQMSISFILLFLSMKVMEGMDSRQGNGV